MMLMMKWILHFLYENDGDVDEFMSSWTVQIHEQYMNCICIQFTQPQFCDKQAWKCDNWHLIFIHVSICVMLTNNYMFCVKGSQRLTYSRRVNLTNNYTVWKESRLPQFILFLAPYNTTLHCIGIGITFLIIMIGHRGKMSHKTDLFITQGGGEAAGWQVQYWSC